MQLKKNLLKKKIVFRFISIHSKTTTGHCLTHLGYKDFGWLKQINLDNLHKCGQWSKRGQDEERGEILRPSYNPGI